MNKGFTLMEVLAVMLVIAVVATFLVPAIRSARSESSYQRAKGSAIKMAEAMRSYYHDSKGYVPNGSVDGMSNQTFGGCPANSPSRTGIPPVGGPTTIGVSELFNCNYLSWKDFEGLPYTFNAVATPASRNVLVEFTGGSKAGQKYTGNTFKIMHDMTVYGEDDL